MYDADEILKKIWETFGQSKKPERITAECNYDDKEREQIEKHFQGIDRHNMSQYDVSMMLIDGALIEPKSYLYYLPRLANDVLKADADVYFLNSRINALLEIDDLTHEQKGVLSQLKELLTYCETEIEDE